MNRADLAIKNNCRRGNAFLLTVIFLVLIFLWVIAFNRVAFQTSHEAFRSEFTEMGKHLVEGAVGEVFRILDNETTDPNHPHTRWLIDRSDNRSMVWNLSDIPLMQAATADIEREWVLKVDSLKVTATKRTVDFRNRRNASPSSPEYYEQEGHGTIVFVGTLVLSRAGQPSLSLKLEAHHDYKIACIVSRRQTGAARDPAKNLNLDYVLYVRDGLREFRQSKGRMLNRDQFELAVKPKTKGRIYFGLNGVTGTPDDFVFVNVPLDQVPPAIVDTRTVTFGELGLIAQRILTISPAIEQTLIADMAAGRLGYYGALTPRALLQDLLQDLAPIRLRSSFHPITFQPVDPLIKYVQDGIFEDPDFTRNPRDNTEPGISLLEAGDDPKILIEGTVRKRFLDIIESPALERFVRTGLSIPIDADNGFLAALFANDYRKHCLKLQENRHPFIQAINEILEDLAPSPLLTPVSRIDDELPYGLMADADRKTQPLPPSLSENYQPFQYENLRSYSVADANELASIGVFEGTTLKPHGGIHVRSSLTLGESGPILCDGVGIISTSGDLTLTRGITCSPGSVLLLSAAGKINIETSELIEAAVVGRTLNLSPGESLNLRGSLWVEKLGSEDWPKGFHQIEYDVDKFFRYTDLYSANLSSRATFQRMTVEEP